MLKTEIKQALNELSIEDLREAISLSKSLIKAKDIKVKSLDAQARDAFKEFYKENFKADYYYTGKDAQAMKLLIAKVISKLKDSYVETPDALVLNSLQLFFIKVYELKDEWINSHFTLSVIDSQFNSIYLRLKIGKNGSKVTNDYKERVLRDLLS